MIVSRLFLCWLCCMCCITINDQLYAQKRTTVLTGGTIDGDETMYRFYPSFYAPPTIARFGGVQLNLGIYANKLTDDKNYKVLNFYTPLDSRTVIGTININKQNTTSLAILLNLNEQIKAYQESSRSGITIKRKFTEDVVGNVVFNSSDINSGNYRVNKIPRLVVDYELTNEPYGAAWSQSNGNAQHTNQVDWMLGKHKNTTAGEDEILIFNRLDMFEVLQENKNNTNFLSVYKNKPIVFSKLTLSYVIALSGSITSERLWSIQLGSLPVKQPVITPDGKMIFVSDKQTLEVLDLNEGRSIQSKALSDIKITIRKGETHNINNVTNDITLGYDGALYMPISNANGNFGIVALSAYPQLRPRWFYNTINAVGPVSLSQNEKLAFFIETDKNTAKSRLVVLDNVNGAVLTQSDAVLRSYTNDGNSYIPPVVVQTSDDQSSVVYVLDGNKTSNKLYVFKVRYDQFFDEYSNRKKQVPLAYVKRIESKKNINEGISKPAVLNSTEVLFIQDGVFQRYNVNKDIFATDFEQNTMGEKVVFKDDANILTSMSEFSDVVILSGSDLYFKQLDMGLNNVKEDAKRTKYFDLKANYTNAIINANLSTFVQLANGAIQHFYPVSKDVNDYRITNIKNKNTYSGKKGTVWVAPQIVTENTQAIVQGGNINLSTGFIVQKGASLIFQTIK